MYRLTPDTRPLILRCLTDGMCIRAASRLTGASKGAVLRLLAEAGEFAAFYQDRVNLPTKRVDADEIWSFCGAKQRNATGPGQGDLWTYCAIDAESKLFVAGRGTEPGEYGGVHRVYSPPVCIGCVRERRVGRPDPDLISTSYIESPNMTTRQNCRRFTRLTNAHSKKAENHAHAVALTFLVQNFVKAHTTLTKAAGRKTRPAMAAGLTDRIWTVEDILARMDPNFLLH